MNDYNGEDKRPNETLLQWRVRQLENSQHEVKEEVKAMGRVLIGILVAVATAAVLLALNLAVSFGGGGGG